MKIENEYKELKTKDTNMRILIRNINLIILAIDVIFILICQIYLDELSYETLSLLLITIIIIPVITLNAFFLRKLNKMEQNFDDIFNQRIILRNKDKYYTMSFAEFEKLST